MSPRHGCRSWSTLVYGESPWRGQSLRELHSRRTFPADAKHLMKKALAIGWRVTSLGQAFAPRQHAFCG